jgi:hypothetical protein
MVIVRPGSKPNTADLRNGQRMAVKTAAEKLEWSEAKMWRIETGQTSLRSLDVEAMCRIYDAPPDLTEALMGLAKETKAKGWWHAYGDVIPENFDVYLGPEEAAECVEVGQDGPQVAVRDTRDRRGPVLAFSQQGWQAFTRRIRDGAADPA